MVASPMVTTVKDGRGYGEDGVDATATSSRPATRLARGLYRLLRMSRRANRRADA